MVSRRLLAFVPLLVLLAVAAAGCGSSSKDTSSSAATTTTGNAPNGQRAQALAAFQTCLASHGVKLGNGRFGRPPGGLGANGQPPAGQPPAGQPPQGRPAFSAKQQQAFTACRSKLPGGGRRPFGQGGGFGGGQSNPAFAKYTQCLRQHGVTFGGTNDQATFQKARTACAKYAPTPGGGAGSGS